MKKVVRVTKMIDVDSDNHKLCGCCAKSYDRCHIFNVPLKNVGEFCNKRCRACLKSEVAK